MTLGVIQLLIAFDINGSVSRFVYSKNGCQQVRKNVLVKLEGDLSVVQLLLRADSAAKD